MAFPTTTQTLSSALQDAFLTAIRIKAEVQRRRDLSAAGNTARVDYIALQANIDRAITLWNTSAATPGIGQYAKDQYNDPALDIAAEFTAMVNAAVALRQWVFDNIPKDAGTGALLIYTSDISGRLVPMTVTPAQTAGFRTACDAFLATIG